LQLPGRLTQLIGVITIIMLPRAATPNKNVKKIEETFLMKKYVFNNLWHYLAKQLLGKEKRKRKKNH